MRPGRRRRPAARLRAMTSPSRLLLLALLLLSPLAQAQVATPATTPPAADQPQEVLDVEGGDPPQVGDTAPAVDAEAGIDAAAPDGPATADATRPGPAPTGEPVVDARTQAEQDYDALYRDPTQDYDPVADATLPAPADLPASYDPWEKLNRRTHAFNNLVDRVIAKPLAQAYVAVAPRPVRLGVSNFFSNLGQPVSALNALLQGKPAQAGHSLGRFLVNATIGVGGVFDPATRFQIPNKSEDLGQTLGVWGWTRSRYVELPLFGPRTVRDVFGLIGDGQLTPIRQIEEDKIRVFTQGLQLVDVRTQLMAIDSLREGATDEYALFRDSWLQRRNYQIQGDRRMPGEDDALPEYLRDDQGNPTVPADAMPVLPGGGGT